jgi:hypothetical protein
LNRTPWSPPGGLLNGKEIPAEAGGMSSKEAPYFQRGAVCPVVSS